MHVAIAEATTRPKKRTASKPAKPQASDKTKATFYLTSDAVRRLGVHAAMTGMDKSSLVESLIQDSLRRFVVSDRGRSTDPATEEGSAV